LQVTVKRLGEPHSCMAAWLRAEHYEPWSRRTKKLWWIILHFLCQWQVIVRALAAVRLDVAQGRRVRACSVHHSADVPFMVSAERTVDCIDGGQPTNERYGVKLAMAQRINMAPDSIDMYCPSHDHDRRANATLAAPNGAGALARRPGVGGLRRCGDSLQPSPGPHGARRHALLRCSGRAGAGRATA
jgi:hypothetical protein